MEILDSLFTKFHNTMSVHLQENQFPMAKHGSPGKWLLEQINDTKLTRERIEELIELINDYASIEDNVFIEEEEDYYQIIQLHDYRIVITHPPFSDAYEITVVKPTIQKKLMEYHLDKKLHKRLNQGAEGILIAGAPGHGKSTFTSALANFYSKKSKIVKTIEKPRDLQVNEEITQFTTLSEDFEKVGDIILLMRPDYVIFDEIRKNKDFLLYTDLRLAGVGMVGVIHSTKPIDAIQRFLNRIELGLIPNVIDTIIFIKNGYIDTVLSLNMIVKTPRGFRDDSLARPVIEVKDFISNNLIYEIFSFGEQIVVTPIKQKNKQKRKNKKLWQDNQIEDLYDLILSDFPDINLKIDDIREIDNDFQITISKSDLQYINRKQYDYFGSLGYFLDKSINIFVQNEKKIGKIFQVIENKKQIILIVDRLFSNNYVDLVYNDIPILNIFVNWEGKIILKRNKVITKRLEAEVPNLYDLEVILT